MLHSSHRSPPPGVWLLVLFVLTANAGAEIYRYRAPDGSIVFTDDPPPGSERVEIHPNLTVLPAPIDGQTETPGDDGPQSTGHAEAATTDEEVVFTYEAVEIASPREDEAIRDNAGNLTVSVDIRPPLRVEKGDRLLVLVDGAPTGQASTATTVHLENIDRGTHSLQAVVVDGNGAPLLRSPLRRFHILRFSRLFRKAGPAQ